MDFFKLFNRHKRYFRYDSEEKVTITENDKEMIITLKSLWEDNDTNLFIDKKGVAFFFYFIIYVKKEPKDTVLFLS